MLEVYRASFGNEAIAPIELREELAHVVERISHYLPPERIWELFASSPGQTGGRIIFPYCRVDGL